MSLLIVKHSLEQLVIGSWNWELLFFLSTLRNNSNSKIFKMLIIIGTTGITRVATLPDFSRFLKTLFLSGNFL